MSKNEKLHEILLDLGLSSNESGVYLASLSLGSNTILSISKLSGIRRTTVYSVVNTLKNKGLMHETPKGFKTLYTAENPNKLESILENKKSSLKKILPEFNALYNLKGGDSTIKHYEGLEAIKNIYENTLESLNPGDDYLVISDIDKFLNMDPKYFEKYVEKRVKQPLKVRAIAIDSDKSRYMKKYAQNMNHEIKILPKNTKLSVDLMILPHKVTIFNLEEPLSAVSIENPAMVKMHKEIFKILWQTLSD